MILSSLEAPESEQQPEPDTGGEDTEPALEPEPEPEQVEEE